MESRIWSKEELELFKVMSDKYVIRTISKKLNIPIEELISKSKELNIQIIYKRSQWPQWKEDYLKNNINKISISKIQEKTGFGYYEIMDKLEELNISYVSTRWTDEEINILKALAPYVYIREIAKVINRTEGAIISKANKIGIKYITLKRDYTEDELKYIKDNWGIIPVTDMARKLNVTRTMIQAQADLMNLKKLGNNPYRKWTLQNINKLRRLAKKKSITELARYFKTTNEAIETIASRNGIKLLDGKVHWQDEDNEKLHQLAKTYDLLELSNLLDKSTSAIRLQAERLGIEIIPNKRHIESIWTEENTRHLKLLAATNKTALGIAITMHKNDETIIKKARELNIHLPKEPPHPWTDEEIEKLKQIANTKTLIELMIIFYKPTKSIKKIAKEYNLSILGEKKPWTDEEYKRLEQLVQDKKTPKEIATILNRTEDAIIIKINRRGLQILTNDKRAWTNEEIEILQEYWGAIPIEKIAQKLDRTVSSIKNKAHLLNLGGYLSNNFDGLTFKEISELLNIDINTISIGWVSLGLKYKVRKISVSTSYRYVEIEELYRFLEANQNIWDARNLEDHILGIEPEWLKEKRKRDYFENPNYTNLKLTRQQLILAKKFFLELKDLQTLKDETQQRDSKKLKKESV